MLRASRTGERRRVLPLPGEEHDRFEVRGGAEPRIPAIQAIVPLTSPEVRQRRNQNEEVANGVPLVEGVWKDGDEVGRHQAAMAEPDHQHAHENGIEHGERVDEPPAVPPPLVDHAYERVEERGTPGHEHHGAWARPHRAPDPAQNPDEEAHRHHHPAPPVRSRERLKILETLLDSRRVVRPSPNPCGKRATGR